MNTDLIIVGHDGSTGARAATRWALDEAAGTGATVCLLYTYELPYLPAYPMLPGGGSWLPEALSQAETMLDAVIVDAATTHPGVTVTREVVRGAAVPTLRDRSRSARLVVLGSRGHGGFAGLLLGSVGDAVSAHAHCPVVIVRPDAGPHRRTGPVLVGVDGSDCSQKALAVAVESAAARGAHLHVLRAVEPPSPLWSTPDAGRTRQVLAAERVALTELVGPWRNKFPDVPITPEVVQEEPVAALLRGSWHAQLVVVGSRGLGGFGGLLLGSVSQRLLHHGHSPVMVVRDESESTDSPPQT